MEKTSRASEEILSELREQTKWLRFLSLSSLRSSIQQVLESPKQQLVYELSDGTRSVRQISEATGVSTGTISKWWSNWTALGLCTESSVTNGRAVHLASLSQLGIRLAKEVNSKSMKRPVAFDANGVEE